MRRIAWGLLLFFVGLESISKAETINFDALADSTAVTDQFIGLGLTFQNTVVLKSGVSLNEFEFPPHSGLNVVSDSGGALRIIFSRPQPLVQAFFTYAQPITIEAFDETSRRLGSVSSKPSCRSNEALSGTAGCLPNELITLTNVGNISSVTITGNPLGGSFTMDDLTFSSSTIALTLETGGAATVSTPGTTTVVRVGYATTAVNSGTTPYGTAVFSLSQNGTVVSEAGVPASPPTKNARMFIDYRTGVPAGAGTIDVYTGFAIVQTGNSSASISYTLRDRDARLIAVGHGNLGVGAHFGKFIHELRDVAPDFTLPVDFPKVTRFGSLEISSDQPLSIVALRLTANQRGETLLTTLPVADLNASLTNSPLYFPQLADGGGYQTELILLNTSSAPTSGTLSIFDDAGIPLTFRETGGTIASTFPYSIPVNGTFVFQTDGSPTAVRVGWVKLTPSSGTSAPTAAGVFSFSPAGILVTESGIPSAIPTTHARLYVDKSSGHDTGIALANPGESNSTLVFRAFQGNGRTTAGNGSATVTLAGNGHSARFVGELIAGLGDAFTGVVDVSSSSSFVALTLRSLTNSRNDFLLSTFPVADVIRPAPAPIVFPQLADGGGYATQVIFISATGPAAVAVSFLGNDGSPLDLAGFRP